MGKSPGRGSITGFRWHGRWKLQLYQKCAIHCVSSTLYIIYIALRKKEKTSPLSPKARLQEPSATSSGSDLVYNKFKCGRVPLFISFHLDNMAPVALPPPMLNNFIEMPHEIHDPPLDLEVIQTRQMFDAVRIGHGNNRACSG